jgi:hypothetical protein
MLIYVYKWIQILVVMLKFMGTNEKLADLEKLVAVSGISAVTFLQRRKSCLLPSVLMEVSGQLHALAVLHPENF